MSRSFFRHNTKKIPLTKGNRPHIHNTRKTQQIQPSYGRNHSGTEKLSNYLWTNGIFLVCFFAKGDRMYVATETVQDRMLAIDRLEPSKAVETLVRAQITAAASVMDAASQILQAGESVAQAVSMGKRVYYCGAGSSGLMAMADALELPGTFGIARESISILLAGGARSIEDLAGTYEDDREAGSADLERAGLSAGDCVITVSASGRTPYALGAADAARRTRATLVAIANTPNTPLLDAADIAILLQTQPEPVAGSTRLGAGTAQKIALNSISTLACILLGHVHDGMMVNLHADNVKLRERALRIVCAIAGVDEKRARNALEISNGALKPAVLLARGVPDLEAANALLARTGQNIRLVLQDLDGSPHTMSTTAREGPKTGRGK
jgi:N-acetylmuramic acid 6-phosphate etherase